MNSRIDILYNDIKNELNKNQIKENLLIEQHNRKLKDLKKIEKDLKHAEEAKVIIRHIAQKTQEQLQWKISEMVSLALSSVFDDPYEFSCTFEIKRGKSEAILKFEKDGEFYDPIDETGGGVIDIASFGLRIACWKLSGKASVIILDEPFKHLSFQLQKRIGDILKLLTKELGIQFIIITHSRALEEYADKIFEIEKKDKISRMEVKDV